MNKKLLMAFLKERNENAKKATIFLDTSEQPGNMVCHCECSRQRGIQDFTGFLITLIIGGTFDGPK